MSDFKDFDRLFRLDGKVALITGGMSKLSLLHQKIISDLQVE